MKRPAVEPAKASNLTSVMISVTSITSQPGLGRRRFTEVLHFAVAVEKGVCSCVGADHGLANHLPTVINAIKAKSKTRTTAEGAKIGDGVASLASSC